MSVNIETAASDSTLQSLDPLKTTTNAMHLFRVWVELTNTNDWYLVIREANALYGPRQWKGQPRTKRKLDKNWPKRKVRTWFDVPDPTFATWISVKHGVNAALAPTK